MTKEENNPKRKRPLRKIILWIIGIVLILIATGAIFLYINFNRLLSEALIKSFNTTVTSDVYDLKFEKLRVNPFVGSIDVINVVFEPKEKPLNDYPYINSTLRLKTSKLLLKNVDITMLLKLNRLNLERVEITEPEIDLNLTGENYIIFPFGDTTKNKNNLHKKEKKPIDSFFLKEFELINASIHVKNEAKKREFKIKDWSIVLNRLLINQNIGKDMVSLKDVELTIGKFEGNLQKGAVKKISFEEYKIKIEDLKFQKSIDTLTYQFAHFSTGLKALDIQTADSTFHVTMESFNLAYKHQSITINNVSFKPNMTDAQLQKRLKYQKAQVNGTIGLVQINHIDFDALIYQRKILIDEIVLDKVVVHLFKDKSKPMDKNRFPQYFGQQIKSIPIPVRIKKVTAKNAVLYNQEKKVDGSIAKVSIQRGTVQASNITNMPTNLPLSMSATAYIDNKVKFNATLNFSYRLPEFTFLATIPKFNLYDLNGLIKAYTPASVNKGITDEISFFGTAYQAYATGTMKFLYHDLDIGLDLKDQARWKSSVLEFAANTVLPSANPSSQNHAPRIVQYHVERDMNKGFVNIVIKSLLAGLKETMVMSKENKKAFKETKKAERKEKRKSLFKKKAS